MLEIKQQLLKLAYDRITNDIEVLRRAAEETHANSTSAESKAEGKYDTRGIEASYLAEGQTERLKQAEAAYKKLEAMEPEDEPDNVLIGSLAVVTGDERELNYLVMPTGGGITLELNGEDYLIITPESPIGQEIIGQELGASIKVPNQKNAYLSEIY